MKKKKSGRISNQNKNRAQKTEARCVCLMPISRKIWNRRWNAGGILLNINYGHNKALMDKCRRLKEYAILVSTVRAKLAEGKPLEEAVEETVDDCIEHNILRDILEKNRAEVIGMILTSFDQEEYEKTIRDESYEEGHSDGYKEGRTDGYNSGFAEGEEQLLRRMIEKKLSKGKSAPEIAAELDMEKEQIFREIEKMEKK